MTPLKSFIAWGFFAFLTLFSGISILMGEKSGMIPPWVRSATLTLIIALFAVLIVIERLGERKEYFANEQRITDAEEKLKEEPQKAKPAWDLARLTLEQYFNRNLSQINLIFWLSIFVMLAGFFVIIWGIQQGIALATSGEKLDSLKSLPPIISAFAGIVTEFIGATFLFIYRSTMEQATSYAKTLERINSVGMAMQILDTMPETAKAGEIKWEAKATLVELLVRGVHNDYAGTQKKPAKADRKKTE